MRVGAFADPQQVAPAPASRVSRNTAAAFADVDAVAVAAERIAQSARHGFERTRSRRPSCRHSVSAPPTTTASPSPARDQAPGGGEHLGAGRAGCRHRVGRPGEAQRPPRRSRRGCRFPAGDSGSPPARPHAALPSAARPPRPRRCRRCWCPSRPRCGHARTGARLSPPHRRSRRWTRASDGCCDNPSIAALAGRWAVGRDFADMHGTARDEIITGRQPARARKERARHRVLADADRRGDPHSGNAKSGAAHRFISDDWTSIS